MTRWTRTLRSALGFTVVLFALGASSEAATRLELLWSLPTGLQLAQASVEDELGRGYLFAAVKSGGVQVLELSGSGPPSKLATVERGRLGGLDAMHLTQQRRYLYVALGDFFNAFGSKAGLAVIDVSHPATPRVVGTWISTERIDGSVHVVVRGDVAYLAAMRAGIFVFDVSDPRQPTQIGFIQPDIHFPRPDPNRTRHPNARGLALRGHLLFVAYDAGGLRVVDVTDPRRPREIHQYINAALPEKPQAYNNIVLEGRYAYLAVDYCGLEIVDVSDPQAIQQVGWWNPWACETLGNLWLNSPGHTNQLALDRALRLVYLSAGDSELQVVDVSAPGRPTLAASFGRPKNERGAWGVTMGEDAVYLAYIRAAIPFKSTWSGFKAVRRITLSVAAAAKR